MSSHACSASASAASVSPRSATYMRDAGEWAWQRSSTSASRSGRRATMADGGAPLGEHRGEGGADARRRAGDEDVGAVDLHGAAPYLTLVSGFG